MPGKNLASVDGHRSGTTRHEQTTYLSRMCDIIPWGLKTLAASLTEPFAQRLQLNRPSFGINRGLGLTGFGGGSVGNRTLPGTD